MSRKISRRLLVYQKCCELRGDEQSWYPVNQFQDMSVREVMFSTKLVLCEIVVILVNENYVMNVNKTSVQLTNPIGLTRLRFDSVID
ncbi:hypothetical protein DICVIV_01064 [Dictyocaulus viviparus]|uniref:Uncharacterized protein n=1 Tax=Dictyocaulus viviparus TaxID=29172 RepID=A0A0D8Y7N4_DICVI|nr:hypothetical protein DICVIV_01064 [Dictyocaulus viviparus]